MAVASPSYSIKKYHRFPAALPEGGGNEIETGKIDFFLAVVEKINKKKRILTYLWKFYNLVKNKFWKWFYIGKMHTLNRFLLSPNVRQVNNKNWKILSFSFPGYREKKKKYFPILEKIQFCWNTTFLNDFSWENTCFKSVSALS